jgi:hypothetical protein
MLQIILSFTETKFHTFGSLILSHMGECYLVSIRLASLY